MLRGLRELLDVMGPTVPVLEEMHWMDESTIDVAEFLVGDFPAGLVLVATYRAEEVSRPGRMRLTKRPTPAGRARPTRSELRKARAEAEC